MVTLMVVILLALFAALTAGAMIADSRARQTIKRRRRRRHTPLMACHPLDLDEMPSSR
jgi:hypothetical protein